MFAKLWLDIRVFFVKHFYGLALTWWKLWSRAYRKFDGYSEVLLPKAYDPQTVGSLLSALQWTPDGGKELWDVCRSPNWVEFCLTRMELGYPQPPGALDCDEFAVWSAHVLSQKYTPYMLTVSWVSPTREILGHALCIGRNKDGKLFHLGNWGYRPGFSSLKDLCLDVAKSGGASEPVAWAILDKDLNMMTWGKGTPKGPEYNNVLVSKR